MEASDISRITYELIRQHDDRLMMKWEDDRGYLLKEIRNLKKKIKKDEKTSQLLRSEIEGLYDSCREKVNEEIHSGKRKLVSKNLFTAKTEENEIKPTIKKSLIEFPQENKLHYRHSYDNNHNHNRSHSINNSDSERNVTTTVPRLPPRENRTSSGSGSGSSNISSSSGGGARRSIEGERREVATGVVGAVAGSGAAGSGSGSRAGTNRSKSEREMMNGHECEECRRYYRIMEQQGLITASSTNLECGIHETLRRCSRHKSHWSPPCTPDGFWDLTVHTPEDWRASKTSNTTNWRRNL